ncbi:uncharacterized protein LOC123298771 [Chrysoperla carnea]|uniref:uncharacterized protein LOC123298771 n=1 Tax=Chrysoperla carnea TaxID=189513 RepID=UPI001D094C78|nr:uncharacterized protein LOC123298771 [Chrysoperla carnea]
MDTDSNSEIDNSEKSDSSDCDESDVIEIKPPKDYNVVHKIFNRQLYGRFSRNPKAKTDKVFNSLPDRLCFNFSEVVPFTDETIHQVFMGFSQCGRFLLSYSVKHTLNIDGFFLSHQYVLHVWSFVPGRQAKLVAEHRIFRHFKHHEDDLEVTMCQWPTDLEKLVIYGTCQDQCHQSEAYLTIVTLPSMQRCKDCTTESSNKNEDTTFMPLSTSQCLKHGVTVDAMLSIMPPYPKFRPNISLAYPDHIILNTGHYLYALNISLDNNNLNKSDENGAPSGLVGVSKTASITSLVQSEFTNYPDNMSDISESVSIKHEYDVQTQHSACDFVSDVSDCETDLSEYSKPFHELNISCEPLNVTGRSYWTSSSIVPESSSTTKPTSTAGQPPRGVKMSLHKKEPTTSQEKKKIDIESAEKAYEFTEETEKCEKLSLFRKKRLADKKYEFSEDNCENIVPFNLLRFERRFCGGVKGQTTSKSLIRSPDNQFLSPRNNSSPRSPILSPNSRGGPFSPSGSGGSSRTCVYNRLVSPSPTNRKSPLSPRGEKYNIYSPSHIDDYSDIDSKFVLRQINNISSPKVTELSSSDNFHRRDSSLERFMSCSTSSNTNTAGASSLSDNGLLIVDDKAKVYSSKDSFQWIKEIVRRYSAIDFESASSLVSDGLRDDYVSVELPVLVHTKSSGEEHHLDAVPSHVSDDAIGPGITLVHKTFDAEQFCHRTAKRICTEHDLKFTFCADYDINIIDICPLSGDVICSAYIEVGATKGRLVGAARVYCIRFIFVWGAGRPGGSHCIILNSDTAPELRPLYKKRPENPAISLRSLIPRTHFRKTRVMVHYSGIYSERSLTKLRDEDNLISIVYDAGDFDDFYFI